MLSPKLNLTFHLLKVHLSICLLCIHVLQILISSSIQFNLQNLTWAASENSSKCLFVQYMINCRKASRKKRKCGVTFWKEIQISFYLSSVSGHFRDYWHNQDKCEAQNDRMKYHNCIQKHPLRVSELSPVCESTGRIFCGVDSFLFTRPKRFMCCISFL